MLKSKINITVLFIILIFSISTTYLIFKYYQNNYSNYYLVYSFISAFALIIFTLVFFLKNNLKEKILLVLISCYLTLLCLEILINIHTIYFKEAQVHFGHAEYTKLYKKNKNYVRPIFPHLHANDFANISKLFYPLTGISQRPTLMCAENGYFVSYTSDRYGFNNNDEVWNQKEVDFLLIGDSFVHGYCMERQFNFAGRIQEYTKKKVINIGYGGTGPLIQLAQLKEYGFKIKPKKIMWIYGEGNDLDNLRDELNIPIIKKYLTQNFSQKLIFKQKEIDQFLLKLLKKEYALSSKYQEIEKKSRRDFLLKNIIKLYMVRKNTINHFLNLDKDKNKVNHAKNELKMIDNINGTEKNLKMFYAIAKKFKELSISQNSELYFVYLPNYIRYNKVYAHANEGEMFNRDKIIKIISSLNIPIIDLHEKVFKLEKDPLSLFPYRKNRHYNHEGFDKSSKAIINNVNY